MSPDLLAAAVASMPTRERECLRLAGQRLNSKEAARLLALAPSTVRTLQRRATERLNVADTRTAAAVLAQHEADDPVVSAWLQRLLTTVSTAAVVLDRGRAEHAALTLTAERPPPAVDDGRAAPGTPPPDRRIGLGDGQPPDGRPGGGPAGADSPGVAARAPGDRDGHGADRASVWARWATSLERSAADDLVARSVTRTIVAAKSTVFGLLGVAGLWFIIRSVQHWHEVAP